MMHSTPIAALLGLWAVSAKTAAVPVFQRRQAPNCTDISHTIDTSCWATLDLTNYVTKWASNSTCGSKSFAQCFLDSVGLDNLSCDHIQNDACVAPDPSHFTSQSQNQAENFYVAYNIYSINQAFNTYFTAINDANTLASENVASIVKLLDPPMDTNGFLNDLLSALSVGLSFLGPESEVISGLVKGASAAVSVAQYIFPRGTINSQIEQFSALESQLGDTIKTMAQNIDNAMPVAFANATNFLGFAQDGSFSQQPETSIFNDTSKLLQGLNTYVISQAMQANKIVVGSAPQIDINAWVASGKVAKTFKTSCGSGYDSLGICDAWYYDPNGKTTYTMVDTALQSKNYHDVMETIFSNWTTPDLLFVNAAACAAMGNSGHPGNVISVGATNVSSDCLSNTPVCVWNQNDKSKAFTNCNNPQNWGALCISGTGGAIVPAGYIGPQILATNGLEGGCR